VIRKPRRGREAKGLSSNPIYSTEMDVNMCKWKYILQFGVHRVPMVCLFVFCISHDFFNDCKCKSTLLTEMRNHSETSLSVFH